MDEKFENYQVPLYLDDENLKMYKESGLQLQIKEDSDGKYVVFKRKHTEYNFARKEQVTNGPVEVRIRKGKEYVPAPDILIGNGSVITCKVEAYDTPRRGVGTKGHRLLAVAVEELVEYTPPSDPAQPTVNMPF